MTTSTIEQLRPVRPPEPRISPAATDTTLAPRSLRRNVTMMFLANVAYAGCQWGQLIVLAKLGGAESVGAFAWGLAVTAPVMMVASLQLRTLQATDAREEYRFSEYLYVRLATCAMALVAMLIVVLATSTSTVQVQVVLAVGFAKSIEAVSDILFGLFQKHDCMSRIAASLVVKGMISIIALSAGMWIFRDTCAAVLTMAAAWMVVLVGYDVPNALRVFQPPLAQSNAGRRRAAVHPNPRRLVSLALQGLPLGMVVGVNSLNQNIPRYILESSHGARQLGFFAGVAAFMRLGFYVESALTQSSMSRLSNLARRDEHRKFYQLVFQLALVAAAVGAASVVASILLGRPVLKLLYSAEFAEYQSTFVCVNFAAAIGYVAGVLKAAADARRALRWQLPLMIVCAVITTAAGLVLIPTFSLLGAAMVLIVAKLCLLVGYCVVLGIAHRASPQVQ